MKIITYSPKPWEQPDGQLDLGGSHQLLHLQGELGTMVRQLTTREPDLVLISGFEPADPAFVGALERLCLLLPQAAVVIVHPNAAADEQLSLMRAGVREVLAESSQAALRRVVDRVAHRVNGSSAKGCRVIGFASAKGGDGSSFLTANLASALSQQGRRVLAIDLALPFGDLDLYLTGESHPDDLADISSQSGRLDQPLLSSMVHRLGPSLDLIASPTTFEKTVRIEPEQVRELVEVATGIYDYLLLDFGPSLDQVGIWALDHLDELFIVATPSLPSLRRAGQLLQLQREFERPVERTAILLNCADSSERISASEMEKVIGRPVDNRFPADREGVEESLLLGMPFLKACPKSKLARTIEEWAAALSGSNHQKPSLWQRLKIR